MINELIEIMEWMLKDMESKREFGGPSPEFEKAKVLLGGLKQYRGGGIISKPTREGLSFLIGWLMAHPHQKDVKMGKSLEEDLQTDGVTIT